MNPLNQTEPKKFGRSVSIIGIGTTPFMETVRNPETNGLTEGELFGYAALKAMEDAGVSPKDIEFYFHGCANPLGNSNYLTPNMQVSEWFGMRGKASMHHSEACCTGYLAVDIATQSIASGKYDIILTGGIDFGDGIAIQGKPSYIREPVSFEQFQRSTEWLHDNAYSRHLLCNVGFDNSAAWYQRKADLSDDEIDKALCMLAIVNRENAALNPLAIDRVPYEDEAREAGFSNAMEYLQSDRNPKLSSIQRISGLEHKCDGATCLILCATELAEKFTKNTPVEIMGIGNATLEKSNPFLEVRATQEATRQVYNVSGVLPEEIDLLYVNDFIITSQLISAEISGYIPENQAWKYVMDGRTRCKGDKPINPNGGRTAFGHAHAASGLADFYDAVLQMRGQAGAHQVCKTPHTVFLRGYGGGQNVCNVIIRSKT